MEQLEGPGSYGETENRNEEENVTDVVTEPVSQPDLAVPTVAAEDAGSGPAVAAENENATDGGEIITVDVNAPTPHPENPRKGDVAAIMRSLQRFGQVKPIIVQKSTGYVVAGNHTLAAAKKLGWETIQVLVQEMDDQTARAYLITDNRTSDRGTYKKENLYSMLEDMMDNLEGTGWDIDDVETLGDEVNAVDVDDVTSDPVVLKSTRYNTDDNPQLPEHKEAMREIILLMTVSQAQEFGAAVNRLQKEYGTKTIIETVRKAVIDADSRIKVAPSPVVPKVEAGF